MYMPGIHIWALNIKYDFSLFEIFHSKINEQTQRQNKTKHQKLTLEFQKHVY